MAHGGYGKRRVAGRKPKPVGASSSSRGSKGLGVDKKAKPKPKSVSIKNQIRSIERMLRKDLPPEVREAQEKKLEGFKKQQDIHSRLAVEQRRKIERRIRRLEKMQRTSSGQSQEAEVAEQLSKLKEDLEYVRFFPKTEKYVALFMGGDETDMVDRRNRLRKQIKANIIAAAASGKDLEALDFPSAVRPTSASISWKIGGLFSLHAQRDRSEDDGLLDLSEDDFFLAGSSSDEAEADDEWTDRSAREQASSASGKASGMSSDERNQRHISARALMPPPRPSSKSFSNPVRGKSRFGGSSSKKQPSRMAEMSTSGNTSNSTSESSFRNRGFSDSRTGQSNLSSNSDAHKPRRKRRPKKKRQQVEFL
ncbi:hypothetical protein C3L33_15027, partial [Rhododendron williamsianum]